MKYFLRLFGIFTVCFVLDCSSHVLRTGQSERRFLYKTNLDTSMLDYGSHIEIKQVLPPIPPGEFLKISIDDRDAIARSKYSRDDQIRILGEFLTFRGDTSVSNKTYEFKGGYHMGHPAGIKGFTVEIEALYSFTRLLTSGFPPIRPMLIDRVTGEELNTKPEKVSEIYDIYVKWYKENAKTGFKNIKLPLEGSPYCWRGEEKGLPAGYLRKSL